MANVRGAVDVLTESLAAPAGLTWAGMNHGQRRVFLVLKTPDLLVAGFVVRPDLIDPNDDLAPVKPRGG